MQLIGKLAFLLAIVLATTTLMRADSIFTLELASAGTAGNSGQTNSMGSTIQIAPHPAWSNALGTSSWISFANTGNPNAPEYVEVSNGTVVNFFDHFTMSGNASSGWLEVMADDSTSVILNGVMLLHEASTTNNHYRTCSDFGIGCLGAYVIDLPQDLLKTGDNVLEFRVAQRAGSSFGLNYYGQITNVPEPASLPLLITGLAGLAVTIRRQLNR